MYAWQVLQKQINQKTLSHAYLIMGQNQEQKKEILEKFITHLKIQNPDILKTELSKDGKISITQIRNLQHQINLKPYSSVYKIAVIPNADNLTSEAANALLKVLEEPPAHSILILFGTNLENIFSTLISRCQKIIMPPGEFEISKELQEKYNIEKILKADLKDKFAAADKIAKEENIMPILNYWLLQLKEKILYENRARDYILKIWETQKILKTNVNKSLLLENLVLEMHNEE